MSPKSAGRHRACGISIAWLVLALALAGTSFGAGRAGGPQTVAVGQARIDPDSGLARRIGKKKAIVITTQSGQEEDIVRPVVVAGGIKSRSSASPTIPWSEVYRIRSRKPATMTGLWIGFGVGAGIGLAGAIALFASQEDQVDVTFCAGASAVCGLIGAVPGALFGSRGSRWQTLYTAPEARPLAARIMITPGPRGGAVTLTLAF